MADLNVAAKTVLDYITNWMKKDSEITKEDIQNKLKKDKKDSVTESVDKLLLNTFSLISEKSEIYGPTGDSLDKLVSVEDLKRTFLSWMPATGQEKSVTSRITDYTLVENQVISDEILKQKNINQSTRPTSNGFGQPFIYNEAGSSTSQLTTTLTKQIFDGAAKLARKSNNVALKAADLIRYAYTVDTAKGEEYMAMLKKYYNNPTSANPTLKTNLTTAQKKEAADKLDNLKRQAQAARHIVSNMPRFLAKLNNKTINHYTNFDNMAISFDSMKSVFTKLGDSTKLTPKTNEKLNKDLKIKDPGAAIVQSIEKSYFRFSNRIGSSV